MNSPSAEFAISGMMLLAGAAMFVFCRSPRIGILLRPLSWSLGMFGLGIWGLFGVPLSGTQTFVVPLAMTLSILWGIRPERDPVPVAARKLGARFVSLGFLVLLGISGDLAVLFFASEAASLSLLAEHSWDSPLPDRRQKLLARTLGALALLGVGVASIASFARTTSLDTIEIQLTNRWERSGLLMQDAHEGTMLLRTGVILLLTGAAWRLSFFPFSRMDSHETDESPSSESQIVHMISITVLLSAVIPRLVGEFELAQILLVTFGLLTFLRATTHAKRAAYLHNSLRELLGASAALIWIALALGLQGSRTDEPLHAGFHFPGEEILIFELVCAVTAFLLLENSIERHSDRIGQGLHRERLTGMIQHAPVSALLWMFLILMWTGLFAIRGRWALLFEGFQIAASNDSAAGGYFLISSVVLVCLCLQQLLALQLCQMICTRGWSPRTVILPRHSQDIEVPPSTPIAPLRDAANL